LFGKMSVDATLVGTDAFLVKPMLTFGAAPNVGGQCSVAPFAIYNE
jgi:hypothetical protein